MNPLLRGLKHRRFDAPIYLWMALCSAARGRLTFSGRLLGLALAAFTLSGCGVHVRYISTPCLTQQQLDQQKQAEPPKIHDRLTGNADQDIRPIAGSAVRLRAWGEGMLGILGGCVASPSSAPAR